MVNLRVATRHNLNTPLRITEKRVQIGVVVLTQVFTWRRCKFATLTIGLYALTSCF